MILLQLKLLRLEHCDIGTVEISETSTLCVETRQMPVLATEEMSAVETQQMPSVARTDICLDSTHNVDVSEIPIVAISQCSNRR